MRASTRNVEAWKSVFGVVSVVQTRADKRPARLARGDAPGPQTLFVAAEVNRSSSCRSSAALPGRDDNSRMCRRTTLARAVVMVMLPPGVVGFLAGLIQPRPGGVHNFFSQTAHCRPEKPPSPVLREEGPGVRGPVFLERSQPLTPNPSPPSTGARGFPDGRLTRRPSWHPHSSEASSRRSPLSLRP